MNKEKVVQSEQKEICAAQYTVLQAKNLREARSKNCVEFLFNVPGLCNVRSSKYIGEALIVCTIFSHCYRSIITVTIICESRNKRSAWVILMK